MKIATVTSGNKGGTGKTTISLILTLATNYAGIPSLHVDASSEGGAGTLLLGAKPGPYLRDYLNGKASLDESISVYTLDINGEKFDFYMVLNSGNLPRVDLERLFNDLRRLDDYLELVVIDLPAYQDPWYEAFSRLSDAVIKVAEPSPHSLTAVFSAWPPLGLASGTPTIYVLNQPRYYPVNVVETYESRLRDSVGDENVITVPYDYAASRLAPENIEAALLNLSDDFQEAIVKIGQKLLTA